MDKKLVLKMQKIEREFSRALQEVPMANRQDQVQDVVLKGDKGVCIRGHLYIWGVSKSEYIQYYAII